MSWVTLLLGCGLGELGHPPGGDAPDSGAAASDWAELRVGTLNARDLFEEPAGADRLRRLAGVAAMIDRLEAAVVSLQEIENRAVLDELAELTVAGYPYRVLVEGNDPRGIDVAVLSMHPVRAVETHRHELFPLLDAPEGRYYRYARDCLEVRLDIDGVELVLLAVHFKSKRDDDPDWRLAEAQHTGALAESLCEQHPGVRLVVAGDFNDVPGSDPMQAVQGIAAERGCGGRSLVSVAAALPESERWTVTSWSEPSGVALHDDLLVDPELGACLEGGSVRVVRPTDLAAELGEVTDHAALSATFRWPLG